MKKYFEPLVGSPLRKLVSMQPPIYFKLSDSPTFMPTGDGMFPEVGRYTIGRYGSRSEAGLPAYLSSAVPQRLGEAILIRSRAREQYLTRLRIDEGFHAHSFGMAALILAAENALIEEDVFRTDPVGEYEDVLGLWDSLIERGVAEVVGDQYFQHRNEPKRGADPVHIYRGGHYQITPPDTAL
jgi:hypothetical protein